MAREGPDDAPPPRRVLPMTAVALDGRLDVRALGRGGSFGRIHDAVHGVEADLGDGRRVLLFAVGAAVVTGARGLDARVEAEVARLSGRACLRDTVETFEVTIDPTAPGPAVLWDGVVLVREDPEAILAVALLLAQSAALERHEDAVEPLVDETAELARWLARRGRPPWRRAPVRRIAAICVQRLELARWFFLVDRPDLAWENRDVDRLYDALEENLELRDRYAALEHKLAQIEHTLQLVTTLWEGQRGRLIEWGIVVLILLEIVLAVTYGG